VQHGKVLLAIGNSFFRDLLARVLGASALGPDQLAQCRPQELLAHAAGAQVVITDTADDALPGPCTHLLAESPDLLVVVVSWKADRVFAYRQITAVEELKGSAEEVISAICRRLT
jgi:hypothetical protein